MNLTVAIALIVFLAVLVQSVSGSGLVVVAMPLLVSIISLAKSSSLMGLVAICTLESS